jgi:hypothetical protein
MNNRVFRLHTNNTLMHATSYSGLSGNLCFNTLQNLTPLSAKVKMGAELYLYFPYILSWHGHRKLYLFP